VVVTPGGHAGRRKRGKHAKAERLWPVAEDVSSTTDLFVTPAGRPIRTERRASSLPPGSSAYQPMTAEASASAEPLVRYEWRTAAGDVLVVEAAWPTPPTESVEKPVDLRRSTRARVGDDDLDGVVRFDASGA
jgi:hypothetical protein